MQKKKKEVKITILLYVTAVLLVQRWILKSIRAIIVSLQKVETIS
jgi:hypothetical protein